jgi:hypothetical protein
MLVSQSQNAQIKSENSSVEVLNSKWLQSRQKIETPDNQAPVAPKAAITTASENNEKNRKLNDKLAAQDPNTTIDERRAALEKIEQEAKSPKTVTVDGFTYQAKIRNAGTNTIEVLFWEYQFIERANPANIVSHQFLCGVNIKANKEKELLVFSTSSPVKLISLDSLGDKANNVFDEKILINRVEYSDGTIWQRKNWNFMALKSSIDRALGTPWGQEMCRSL